MTDTPPVSDATTDVADGNADTGERCVPGAARQPPPQPESTGPPWARKVPDWQTVGVVVLVGLVFALPMRALFRYQGPPMEEGFMLVFPERVLRGAIPHKDFLHLYGPGSLWALAAWYKLIGVSITAERIFGAVQLGAIVFGVMALARPWGRLVAATVGVVGVLVTTTAVGLTALAWDGAVALAVASVWVGLRARRWLSDPEGVSAQDGQRHADRLFVASGALAGVALLFRPDVIVGVALSALAVLAGLGWARRRWLTGAVPVLSLYLVHLAWSGPANAIKGMFIQPVFDLRAGRSLPRPPSYDHLDGALAKVASLRVPGWSLPAMSSPHQAFWWFFLLPVATLAVVVIGWWRVRAEPEAWRPRVVLAVGLLGLGLMPQAFQRPDTTHLAWVSCVPVAFLPAALAELFSHARRRGSGTDAVTSIESRWRVALAPGLASVVAMAIPLFVFPHYTARTYVDLARQSLSGDVFGYPISHDGRRFYLGSPEVATVAQRMLDQVGPDIHGGQRLFVGTADLRKTPYSDAYLYYLLPEATPGTRYIEMDPAVANAPDSGLAAEVVTSDWLILSHVWDAWAEPNASLDLGPDRPNQEVRRHFCAVGDYAPYFEVYRRCR